MATKLSEDDNQCLCVYYVEIKITVVLFFINKSVKKTQKTKLALKTVLLWS